MVPACAVRHYLGARFVCRSVLETAARLGVLVSGCMPSFICGSAGAHETRSDWHQYGPNHGASATDFGRRRVRAPRARSIRPPETENAGYSFEFGLSEIGRKLRTSETQEGALRFPQTRKPDKSAHATTDCHSVRSTFPRAPPADQSWSLPSCSLRRIRRTNGMSGGLETPRRTAVGLRNQIRWLSRSRNQVEWLGTVALSPKQLLQSAISFNR